MAIITLKLHFCRYKDFYRFNSFEHMSDCAIHVCLPYHHGLCVLSCSCNLKTNRSKLVFKKMCSALYICNCLSHISFLQLAFPFMMLIYAYFSD